MREQRSRLTGFRGILRAVAISVLAGCGGSGGGMGAPPGQSLQVSPVTSAVSPGKVLHLTATLTKTDGTHADVTPQATWSVRNKVIALATAGGRIVAISPGSTTINATYQGTVGETLLDVTGASGSVAPGYAYFLAGDVVLYLIESNGSMVPSAVPPMPVGTQPSSMAVDPAGRYLYVVDLAGRVFQFAVGAGGALQALSPQYVGISAANVSSASATIDPTGRFLYVVFVQAPFSGPSAIAQYVIDSDGTLRAGQPFVIQLPVPFYGLTIGPAGLYAYVSGGAQLLQYSIGSTGTLTPIGSPVSVPSGAGSFAIAPSGQNGYALTDNIFVSNQPAVTNFFIGPDGALRPSGQTTTVNEPNGDFAGAVSLVFGGAGPSAYLLVSYALLVEASTGGVATYHVNAIGLLAPYAPDILQTHGAPFTGAIYGPNLYLLTNVCNGPYCPSPFVSQIYISRYTIDETGALQLAGEIDLGLGYTDMILMPAN